MTGTAGASRCRVFASPAAPRWSCTTTRRRVPGACQHRPRRAQHQADVLGDRVGRQAEQDAVTQARRRAAPAQRLAQRVPGWGEDLPVPGRPAVPAGEPGARSRSARPRRRAPMARRPPAAGPRSASVRQRRGREFIKRLRQVGQRGGGEVGCHHGRGHAKLARRLVHRSGRRLSRTGAARPGDGCPAAPPPAVARPARRRAGAGFPGCSWRLIRRSAPTFRG